METEREDRVALVGFCLVAGFQHRPQLSHTLLSRQPTVFRQPSYCGLEGLRRAPDEPTLFIFEAEGFFGPGGERMAAHGFCVRDGRRRLYGGTHFLTLLRRWY